MKMNVRVTCHTTAETLSPILTLVQSQPQQTRLEPPQGGATELKEQKYCRRWIRVRNVTDIVQGGLHVQRVWLPLMSVQNTPRNSTSAALPSVWFLFGRVTGEKVIKNHKQTQRDTSSVSQTVWLSLEVVSAFFEKVNLVNGRWKHLFLIGSDLVTVQLTWLMSSFTLTEEEEEEEGVSTDLSLWSTLLTLIHQKHRNLMSCS